MQETTNNLGGNVTGIPISEVPSYQPLSGLQDGRLHLKSGRVLDLQHPEPDMICAEDIAYGLAHASRFTTQSSRFLSLAQHSTILCCLVPPAMRREALLYDAAQAYLGDPTTASSTDIPYAIYRRYKEALMKVLIKKYNLDIYKTERIISLNDELHGIEQDLLLRDNEQRWVEMHQKLGFQDYNLWPPQLSENAFIYCTKGCLL